MRARLWGLFLGVFLSLIGGNAFATSGYFDGSSYTALTSDEQLIYVSGLSDMLSRMTDAVDDPTEKAFLDRVQRCTGSMTNVQLRDFLNAYLASDPSTSGYGMASNFRAALNSNCPQ